MCGESPRNHFQFRGRKYFSKGRACNSGGGGDLTATPATPAARLLRIAAAMSDGGLIARADIEWALRALANYASGPSGTTFEEVAGLPHGRGFEDWRAPARRLARDEHLRRAAALIDVAGGKSRAAALCILANRYARTAWPRELHHAENPHTEGLYRHLWAASKMAPLPVSARQFTRIAGHEMPLFMSNEVSDKCPHEISDPEAHPDRRRRAAQPR